MKYFLIYLIIVNALSFLLMLIDKQKARKKKWRIPERTLMFFSLAGGSVGTLVGMYTFRHKTLHKKFTVGTPLILILQLIGLSVYFFLR